MKKLSVLFVTLATVASITLAGCANAVSSTEPDPTEPDPIVTHTVTGGDIFPKKGGLKFPVF